MTRPMCVAVLSLLLGCAANLGEKEAVDVPPKQTVMGGEAGERALDGKMQKMSADADAIVARATAGGAAAYPGAVLEICFAMRPEFGPANAALPRERKLGELARALGIDASKSGSSVGDRVDEFVQQVREIEATLRTKGFQIEAGPSPLTALLWRAAPGSGWRVLVTDPSREIYESTPDLPPGGKKVHPRVTLWFFEHQPMKTTVSMATRQQPGQPEAAGDAWVAFMLRSPQSPDQDPKGELREVVLGALSATKGRDLPELAKSLGADIAKLDRGLVTIHLKEPLTSTPKVGEGFAILSVTESGGMDRTFVLQPLPR